MKRLAITLALSACCGLAFAQSTPVGLWKTIDDETKQEKSYVRITDADGALTGKVEKIIDPNKQDEVCDKCTDERKGQRKLGMTIVRNVKKNAEQADLWDSGDILDPNNGKVYRVLMKTIDGGRKLEVRGFIGLPLLGRTQTWIRIE